MGPRLYLSQRYTENNFIRFCSQLLKDIKQKNKIIDVLAQFQNYIKECKFIADYKDVNNKKIAVMSVRITDDSNARTIQRNFVSHILSNGELFGYDGALVAYYDESRVNWKLALVTIEYDLTNKGIKVLFQPAKRFSFLVGEGEPSKTYNDQLSPIYNDLIPPTYESLKEAFSISKVTKDFYSDYCDCFNELVKYLIECSSFQNEAKRLKYDEVKEFAITFTKKTLGQIVFLHFIQKKGWLGVPLYDEWGNGDKNYIYNSTKKYKGTNYFNEILEPLFYNALNKKRINDEYDGVKIPFLNGGLFSPVQDYDWKKTNFAIPNSIWYNNKQTGFLDILSQYNFTVDESDPTEQDIAVDPEMLGKIFESLLDPEERHNKGAHYTPREIVHFMCIESMAYNVSINCNINFEVIKNYILYGNSLDDKEIILSKAEEIDTYISKLKIVDPAVGSGAFLVGMLNEIVKLRLNLNELLNKTKNKYEIKKETIKNSLFGVDIENDAIEIAKLRLWLSLIVDQQVEKNSSPKPLPNLMFQLRVGNSLIEEYRGVRLWDSKMMRKTGKVLEQDKNYNLFNIMGYSAILQNLKEAKEKYFSITDEIQKRQLFDQINDLQIELIKNVLFNKGEDKLVEELIEMQKRRTKPFFIWELEFDKVFEEGGFDIVIANPPYIQLQANEGKLADELEPQKYETFTRMGDIYCLFYEQSLNLLKKSGVSCFITSNKWMRAGYGEKLRGFLAKNSNPLLLVDFGGTKVFESATVDVNVLIYSKEKNKGDTKTCIFDGESTNELSIFVEHKASKTAFINSQNWTILNNLELSIKYKLETNSIKLNEMNISIKRGVLTGLNDAFIIDKKLADKFINFDKKYAQIIRPLIRGRDVKRFNVSFPNLYLINIHNGIPSKGISPINIDEYPYIKLHMEKYYVDLKKRKDQGITPYHLRSCSYMDDFSKRKLVYTPVNSEYRFAIVPENVYFPNSLFMIVGDNIDYLCGLFNSKLYRFYLFMMLSNGEYNYGSSSFFSVLPIRKFENTTKISELVFELTNNYSNELYATLNKEIYKIYQLNSDEINYIENIIKD